MMSLCVDAVVDGAALLVFVVQWVSEVGSAAGFSSSLAGRGCLGLQVFGSTSLR